jgi:thioredoxin reductase
MLHDTVIIGGSFAGLSAAMILARARRRVLVIDAGHPRNRYAAHSHGVLAQDGRAPQDLLADAHAQVSAYPTATLLTEEAVSASLFGSGRSVAILLTSPAASANDRFPRLLLDVTISANGRLHCTSARRPENRHG